MGSHIVTGLHTTIFVLCILFICLRSGLVLIVHVISDASRCLGVLLLPQHLREPLETIAARSADAHLFESAKPLIVCPDEGILRDGELSVMVEGVLLCKTYSFTRALALLLACYYVFNLAYPQKGCATLTFMQRCFINLQDGVKANDKVITLLGRINKL